MGKVTTIQKTITIQKTVQEKQFEPLSITVSETRELSYSSVKDLQQQTDAFFEDIFFDLKDMFLQKGMDIGVLNG